MSKCGYHSVGFPYRNFLSLSEASAADCNVKRSDKTGEQGQHFSFTVSEKIMIITTLG